MSAASERSIEEQVRAERLRDAAPVLLSALRDIRWTVDYSDLRDSHALMRCSRIANEAIAQAEGNNHDRR